MEGSTALWLRGAGLVAGGAVFWLVYFDFKDRLRPEPRRLLAAAFVLGGASAILALGAYRALAWLGLPDSPGASAGSILVYCVAVVGVVEEGAKFAVARAVVFRWAAFDEPVDGLVYAATVAVGFATVENVLYVQFLAWPAQLARSLASPLTHSLFAAVWGFGLSRARLAARTHAARFGWQAGTLALAVVLHGAYDTFLLAFDAPYLSAAVSLVLWIFVIVHARRAAARGRSRRGIDVAARAS